MSDVLERIRKAETMPLDADGKVALWETLQDALAEIARLRLTDAEREAVRFCVQASLPETEKLGGVAAELCRMHASTLRGLLARIGNPEGRE